MRIFASAISTDASAIIILSSHTSMLTKTAKCFQLPRDASSNWDSHQRQPFDCQPNALLPNNLSRILAVGVIRAVPPASEIMSQAIHGLKRPP